VYISPHAARRIASIVGEILILNIGCIAADCYLPPAVIARSRVRSEFLSLFQGAFATGCAARKKEKGKRALLRKIKPRRRSRTTPVRGITPRAE